MYGPDRITVSRLQWAKDRQRSILSIATSRLSEINVDQDLATRLAEHRMVGSAPPEERAWLIEHGDLTKFAVGDVVTAKGETANKLMVVLSGHIAIRIDRGAGSHKVMEWRAGDVAGLLPYSRVVSPPGDVAAEEPTEVLRIMREMMPGMIHECPTLTATLVHAMVDRARQFTSSDLRDEKLLSLGKLAAGLAHELNNPSSAVIRSAKTLDEKLSDVEQATRQLAAANLSDSQIAAIERARVASGGSVEWSTVQRADREDEISGWLSDHDLSDDSAAALADTCLGMKTLNEIAESVTGDSLEATLQWISAAAAVRTLTSEIETASSRIHELVAAVKGFSYMDHAPTPEPVDIRRGITDTFTMLGSKARAKSIKVSTSFADDLARAYAVGAELNQVWMNLVDNAMDAVGVGGCVSVRALNEADSIVVTVADDGPGIPKEIQGRIFDPFFTTKPVGEGSGLGLDVVRRLLQRHNASIALESAPGRTVFEVKLPAKHASI
ncbi:MAG TPA: ATP-binding protein [Gemmatimonadaceae bacterium]|nr:ATP-binding protein [Gemmatimonadaceae bacterium]